MAGRSRVRAWLRRFGPALLLPATIGALPLFALQSQDGSTPPADGREGREGRGAQRDAGSDGPSEADGDMHVLPESPPPTKLAASAQIESGDRERSAPVLVVRPEGGAWLVCKEWEAGHGDHLVARALGDDGAVTTTLEVLADAAEIAHPSAVVDAAGRLNVFWTEVVDEVAQLRGTRLDGAAFGAPWVLTAGTLPSRAPHAVVAPDGRIWLAFETWRSSATSAGRGSFDVVAAPVEEGSLGAPIVVGDGAESDLDPTLLVAAGKLWMVWSSFFERDYEVLLRPVDVASPAALAISGDSQSDDVHPTAVAGRDGVIWIAWDRLHNPIRGISDVFDTRAEGASACVHVMVARVTPGRSATVTAAAIPTAIEQLHGTDPWPDGAVPGAPRISWGGGVSRLAIDRGGSLWIAYRYNYRASSRERRAGSPLLLQSLSDHGWSPPLEVDPSIGFCDAGAICAVGDGVLCAAQHDNRFRYQSLWNASSMPPPVKQALQKEGAEFGVWLGPSAIVLAHTVAPAAVAEAPVALFVARLPDRTKPHFHPAGDGFTDPYVSGASHFEITRGETHWQVFFGDLHRHSSISRCSRGQEPMPEDRYAAGRDVNRYDFMAMTEHAGHIDPATWSRLQALVALEKTPTFVPLTGFEVSTIGQGHHNVIFAQRHAPMTALGKREDDSLKHLYERLANEQAVSIPHTPADPGRLVRFSDCDPSSSRLLEIYQALRGSFEFEGCVRQSPRAIAHGSFAVDAVTSGQHFGFIASSDHGNGTSYACALAERLDAASIFEALHAGRTYGATSKGLLVDLRVDDAVMGESVVCPAPPRLRLHARTVRPIKDIVLFRDGKPWRTLGRPVTPAMVEATLDFELPFGDAPPRSEFVLTIDAPNGRFFPWPAGVRIRPNPDQTQPRFDSEGERLTLTWPKGFRSHDRDGWRVRLRAARNAPLTIKARNDSRDISLAQLFLQPYSGSARDASWTIHAYERHDLHVQENPGLGVNEITQEWTDDELHPGSAAYYARVIQDDGEMAWSSPIYVTRS